ncbi:hypothetical protein [Paenibacillus assamensis]|uniref:hypothetical protein n=1 Tax=Paenibacillus assamensis TaxID=311244 RepID=UPI00048E858E|nr:hypothetical protein [Paenibacillus assamensis]
MLVEKQQENMKWFVSGDLKLRQKDLEDERTIIWVSLDTFNICLTMLMYDFVDWCKDMDIDVEVDMSWNSHRGFIVGSKEKSVIRSEIKSFINLNQLKSSENDDRFSDREWYS